MKVIQFLLATAGIMAGVLLLMVIADLVNPQKIEVTIEPDMIILPERASDTLVIDIPIEDWNESANALGKDPKDLTWKEYMEHSNLQSLAELQAYMKTR